MFALSASHSFELKNCFVFKFYIHLHHLENTQLIEYLRLNLLVTHHSRYRNSKNSRIIR